MIERIENGDKDICTTLIYGSVDSENLEKIVKEHNRWKCECFGSWHRKRARFYHICSGEINGNVDLSCADFRGAHIVYSGFRDINLSFSNFRGAYIDFARFENVDLSFADFRGAVLENVSFINVKLNNADFRGTEIRFSPFINSSVYDSKFQGAEISGSCYALSEFKGAHTLSTKFFDINKEGDEINV